MCQAKIDGCRALWDGAELRTRNGQRLDAPDELHGIAERLDERQDIARSLGRVFRRGSRYDAVDLR